jgi:hypothetical protein
MCSPLSGVFYLKNMKDNEFNLGKNEALSLLTGQGLVWVAGK